MRAVLGTPVLLGGVPVGTLDVYRSRPHDWDDSEAAALGRYAEIIATMLGAALHAHTAGELAKQLQYALDYRVLIERAVGFLMAKHSLDAVGAFNALRTAARSRRTKIGVVSEHVLDTGVPAVLTSVVHRLGSPLVRDRPRLDDLRGHVAQLDVGGGGQPTQQLEALVLVDAVALHRDALGHADDVP